MLNLNSLNSLNSFQKGGVSTSSPSNINGLTFWLKADSKVYSDAGTTLAVNNDPVRQWNDNSVSGVNVSQPTLGLRPLFLTNQVNGLPALSFDGSDDILTTAGTFVQQHVFIVTKINATAAFMGLFDAPTGGDVSIRLDGTPFGYQGASGTNGGDWTNGNTSSFKLNGVNTNTIPLGFHVVEGASINPSSAQTISISQNAVVGRFWNGLIAEFIMYSSQLSSTDALTVRRYLGSKYGISVT